MSTALFLVDGVVSDFDFTLLPFFYIFTVYLCYLKKKNKNKKTVRKTERHQERERATHEQGVRRGLGGRQRGQQHMVTNAFPLVEHRPVSLSQHFFLVFAASSPAK